MQFKNIVGQQELIEKLIPLIQEGRLPHALMLLGNEGSGGLPLAIATAQYIICTNRGIKDSCGECAACSKMNKLQHPDVHFSFPTYKKEGTTKVPVSNDYIKEFREFVAENPYANDVEWLRFLGTEKQGNITASECREIIQKLQLRSFESEYKIMIVWYPEYLDTSGNILLKLIEEPTAKTLLFFVTTHLDSVLQTIQSRTQLFPLKRLQDAEIKSALEARGIAAEKATLYARIAEGNYNYALQLCMAQESDFVNTLRNWLNCLYTNKGLELVEWITSFLENNKENQKKFLEYVMQIFEHLIRYKNLDKNKLTLLDSEKKVIDILIAKSLSEFDIEEINNLLNESIYEIERNANTKILIHSLSLRIQKIVLKKNLVLN